MRALLIHIGVSATGAPRRREQRLRVDELKIGRAPSNDLTLPGLSVSFHHATIHHGQATPLLEASPSAELRLNGHLGNGGRLSPGDVIRIGHSELRVGQPGPDEDLVLEVESKRSPRDEFVELRERTRLGVQRGAFTSRRLGLLALAAVLGLFLAGPFGFGWLTESLSSGPLARKHAAIANDCGQCHQQAFRRVANAACATCHQNAGAHTNADGRSEEMTDLRCAACHKDHNGDAKLISMDQPLCERCHDRITEIHPASQLAAVSDFGTDHPSFRFDVVTDPASGTRARIAAGPTLKEHSGVRFNHLRHVGQSLSLPDGGHGNLDCGNCHQPDVTTRNMAPVSFDAHCEGCHMLSFDAEMPDVEALHGDPAKMRAELRALYSERVLAGKVEDARAPTTVRFMRPGKTLSASESKIISTWVQTMVGYAEDYLMNKPGECATCHELVEGAASDGGTAIAPVEIASSWLPSARFSHGTHSPFQCRACHPAAAVYDPDDAPDQPRPEWSLPDAQPYGLLSVRELAGTHQINASERSTDVLIPDRDQCLACHAGPDADSPAIASECILCHSFHRPEHGPLHPNPDASAQLREQPQAPPQLPRALRTDNATGNLLPVAGPAAASILQAHYGVARRDAVHHE